MTNFLSFILGVIKLFIMGKVIYLLYMCSSYPIEYPIENLTWWIYFLVFDIWVHTILIGGDD